MDNKSLVVAVDDEPMVLEYLNIILSPHYDVLVAGSAKALFNLLKIATPDLLLMDIYMPEVDGFEAVRKLRQDERYENIPVIFLTSDVSDVSKEEGLKISNVVDYIYKPVDKEQLIRRINMRLELLQLEKRVKSDLDAG